MRPSTNAPQTDQKSTILNAVSGDVELPQVSRRYVLGLIATAFAVLLLPLLYMSVIALCLGSLVGLYRHVDWLFLGWQPTVKSVVSGTIVAFVIIFVFGLLKPFLAPRGSVKRPRMLRRDTEPVLFAYVDRLCDAIGAPRPSAIHINCDLNAGAEFRRGWLSIFSTRGISLHLGLPLVAGLTLRQLTGVLAHELGHFTQRTAMWLENTVRRTNLWFFRAAYERDSIDEWLSQQCLDRGPMMIVCYPAQAVVWLTRRVLLGLALAGTTISCLMSREMEYNADRCQVRVVGPRSFAATLRRLRELNVAHQISFRDVEAFYEEGRLPDDMIALSVANTAFITPKVKHKLRQMMNDEKTHAFDSHPSDRDRIEAAAADGSPGIFQSGSFPDDAPASILFNRFREVSKAVTEQFYRDALKGTIQSRMLHPVDKLLVRQSGEIDAAKALRRYFQTDIPRLRPLPIASQSMEAPDNPKEVAIELKASRTRMIEELTSYKRLVPRYTMAEETLYEAIAAQSLLQAKIDFKPPEFHLKEITADTITEKQTRAREGVAHLAGKMLPFETEAGNRLSFALQLLRVPSVMNKIPNGDDLWYQTNEMLPAAQYVSRLIGELPTLRIVFHRLIILWERIRGRRPGDQALDVISSQMTALRARLVSIQSEMGNYPYPFDHAEVEMTIRGYALPLIPDERDLGGMVSTAEQLQSRLISIQMRLFARLAQAAEKVEEAIGMPPLPDPKEEECI